MAGPKNNLDKTGIEILLKDWAYDKHEALTVV